MQLRDNYKVAHISSAATTQVDTGNGSLIAIVVNTTAAGAISVIDNTAGSTVNIASLKASIAENTYWFLTAYAAGLRIITAAASDISVIYDPHH